MDEKDNWKQVGVTLRLFGYETQGGRNTELWDNPLAFSRYGGQQGRMVDDDYATWIQSKGIFTQDEVLKGSWIKISDLGSSRKVRLAADGTLTESDLFRPQDSWHGTWKIVSGVLIMRIGEYVLSIYAANEGNLHSGIELFDNKPYAYFKVIHLVEDRKKP